MGGEVSLNIKYLKLRANTGRIVMYADMVLCKEKNLVLIKYVVSVQLDRKMCFVCLKIRIHVVTEPIQNEGDLALNRASLNGHNFSSVWLIL